MMGLVRVKEAKPNNGKIQVQVLDPDSQVWHTNILQSCTYYMAHQETEYSLDK